MIERPFAYPRLAAPRLIPENPESLPGWRGAPVGRAPGSACMSTTSERLKRARQSRTSNLSEIETEIHARHASALENVIALAARHGASPSDLTSARVWPLLWLAEVAWRKKLEPLAEIGRRVAGGRQRNAEDQAKLRAAWEPVVKAAWKFARSASDPSRRPEFSGR